MNRNLMYAGSMVRCIMVGLAVGVAALVAGCSGKDGCPAEGAALRDLQGAEVQSAQLELHVYYSHLDRSLTNRPGLRTGYWPQGRFICRYSIAGQELAQLQRILAHLALVPQEGRGQGAAGRTWPTGAQADEDAASGEPLSQFSVLLRLCGEHTQMLIPNPQRNIVPASRLSAAMAQMRAEDVRYSLPDADYTALMALPSFRRACADKAQYKTAPGPAFESEEEAWLRREVAEVQGALPQLSSAMVVLCMGYPQLDKQQGAAPLLAPYRPPYYKAVVNVDKQVYERYTRRVADTRGKLPPPMPGSMPPEELAQLRRILSHLEAVPVRYLAPFRAAARSRETEDYADVSILLEGTPGQSSARLYSIEKTLIKKSGCAAVSRSRYGDCVRWMLPDAEYDALMTLPSIRRAWEWKQTYRSAPADFFMPEGPK